MSTIPLAQRRFDLFFIVFFAFNFCCITYLMDVEQLTVADPYHFSYPAWPPRAVVDLVHWWGRTYDPALMAREPWWRATIWIELCAFGPFYAAAVWAFAKGRDWIKTPSLLWAAMMVTNVIVILSEELRGRHAAPRFAVVLGANLAWLLVPLLLVARVAWRERPFSTEVAS